MDLGEGVQSICEVEQATEAVVSSRFQRKLEENALFQANVEGTRITDAISFYPL